jgi:hypothetical protein
MSNFNGKATAPQMESATIIQRDLLRLKDLALNTDLRFLAYLIDMAHDEADVISRGKRDQAESASTLAHKD